MQEGQRSGSVPYMYFGHVVRFLCRNEIGLVGPFVTVSMPLFKDGDA